MIIDITEFDDHGNVVSVQQHRTMTFEEFAFDAERAALPLIEVKELSLKADPARWGQRDKVHWSDFMYRRQGEVTTWQK